MFTGIVSSIATIQRIDDRGGIRTFEQFLAAQGSSLNALTHTTARPLQRP
ncbi:MULTISPECIES: hypothetical protein [Vibrio]|nr:MULTISPECIES: hypothetical protein [Vibrio]MCG9678703.1 hypothetical protein [Vibrio sp. Isolate24]